MSYIPAPQSLPSTARLLKATGLAIAVASVLLVTVVLPAEYGIDPTGIGTRLGLDVLGAKAETKAAQAPALAAPTSDKTAATLPATEAELEAKAIAAFGKRSLGQSLDVCAMSPSANAVRSDTLSLTLEPGKGAEVKMHLKQGEGVVFQWKASNAVLLDMHGERPNAKGEWTSYSIEPAQNEARGTFVAPFEGSHGWYWKNENDEPVTVEVAVTGFQPDLHQP
ncbi:hypothetical protein [Pseudomonas aeruginosa]|uniref:hypothetical protein n=1 Tax=Pseudomonas aeruginosa TaxID=287 RepID=UPI0003BAF8A0|nr:hypothetical protein [Pseudomonas aeruginosa]ELQ8280327.1 hypothetical protein [Pseudomonas aeruginosa]ERZ25832.1 hypothetical protein Q007_00505 [Pseudomonas aeruginosa S54485]MCV6201651.1 hypothetical protein [Pseudomonas aeruginosa]PBY73854.1 hypothetical protein CJT47_30355 [Pseudomonas aeruginosa]RPO77925.1 hypothetical protein IPC1180_19110 [Pseudomonas aeruginosa]